MKQTSRENLEPFAIEGILDNSVTDFDLYLELGGAETLYAKAPYRWLLDELTRLSRAGHKTLFYSTADRDKVDAYRLIISGRKVDLTLPPAGRVVQLTDAAAELTRVLYRYPLTPASLAQVESLAKNMVSCVQEDPSCVAALGKLAHHDDYTYYHSARVAAYALAVAMHLSLTDRAHLDQLAVGALLHDVGKSKIDLAVLNKQGVLTAAEWAEIKQHPVYGDQIVDKSILAVIPRAIILHHHERLDGTGYPHSLSERELLEEVKIAAFADVFDALTSNRPYHVSRTHFEALDFIKHKLLKNLHKDSYQAMVELLANAPDLLPKPGT